MKRKLKVFGIIIITLLLPFIINFVNLMITPLILYRFGITDDSIIIHLIGLIALLCVLWIIFIKTKEKYLADAHIAGICFIAAFIGMFFFAIWTEVAPHLSSYNTPDCCP